MYYDLGDILDAIGTVLKFVFIVAPYRQALRCVCFVKGHVHQGGGESMPLIFCGRCEKILGREWDINRRY